MLPVRFKGGGRVMSNQKFKQNRRFLIYILLLLILIAFPQVANRRVINIATINGPPANPNFTG